MKMWEKYFDSYHKCLMSLICKEYLQINMTNNPIETWEKGIKGQITKKKEIEVTQRYEAMLNHTHKQRNVNKQFFSMVKYQTIW